jgi:hypothetical protein
MKRIKLSPIELKDWYKNSTFYVIDGKPTRLATPDDPIADTVRYRALAKSRFLAEHSDVMLVRPDGVLVAVLRRPKVIEHRPSAIAKEVHAFQPPPPEACHCAQYGGRAEGEHHPVCVHRDAWERLSVGRPQLTIIEIATGRAMRLASADEAAEYERTKNPIITIGGEQYGVAESYSA